VTGINTLGLKSDGTAVAVRSDGYGQCSVENWKNIKITQRKLNIY